MSYINLFYTHAGSSQAGSRDPTSGDRRASGNQCAAGAELMLDVYRCAWESSAAVATLLVALRRPPCADGTHMAAPCKAAAACWRVPSFSRARLHCFTIHSMEAEGGDKHLYQASALHSLATCHRSKAAPAGALAPLDCASCLAAFDPYRSLSRPKCITHTMLGAWKRGVGSPTRAGVALPPLPPRHAVAPTGTRTPVLASSHHVTPTHRLLPQRLYMSITKEAKTQACSCRIAGVAAAATMWRRWRHVTPPGSGLHWPLERMPLPLRPSSCFHNTFSQLREAAAARRALQQGRGSDCSAWLPGPLLADRVNPGT